MFTNFEKDNHSSWIDKEQGEREAHSRIEVIISCLSALDKDKDLTIVDGIDEKEVVQQLRKVHSNEMIEAIRQASLSCEKDQIKTTSFDLEQSASYAPIDHETYYSALHSVDSALKAAEAIRTGKKLAFSLSRPPGHHAGRDFYHGFCYFNNAAVAASLLNEDKNKIAILDIDVHHGDGTQNIFYEDPDVFYVSLHADPARVLPHTGMLSEKGKGAGYGSTLNLPFDIGISAEGYKKLLESAKESILKFKPSYLVLSAGFDTHKEEFKNLPPLTLLETADYFDLGKIVHDIDIPICVILEGGYNTNVLGDAFINLAKGLNYEKK